ncbi:MAG: LmbE family protein, partial [Chthoniobacterales bacterium]
ASRTMHKSQGFGVSIDRGAQKEYFKLLEGPPVDDANLFSGIDTTWTRLPKAEGISEKIRAITSSYDERNPAASLPALIELRKMLPQTGDDFWTSEKTVQLDGLIAACLGLHLEAVVEKPAARPGETLNLQLEAINRSALPVKFKTMRLTNGDMTLVETALPKDELVTRKLQFRLPEDTPFSQPYWLREPGTVGTFTVSDQTLIGQPESPPPFSVDATMEIGGEDIVFRLDPRFRKLDRVEGETMRPLVVTPPAFVELPRPVFVFGNGQAKTINVRVIASAETVKGEVALPAPAGWKVEPACAPVELYGAESETTCTFRITPPAQAGEATLQASLRLGKEEKRAAFSRQLIEYPHLEPQTLISPARAQLVRANIENKATLVGYLPGAGDDIPESLHEIGSDVKILNDNEVKAADLARFDAIVVGVRAANVHPRRVAAWLPELVAYAKKGGVVIYQYNTTPGPKPEHLPFPLKISRDRVTDENADVRMLVADHPVLNFPNKITPDDFKGWVQERGLYFANEWDHAWQPILSSNDPGEKPLDGGLLVARLGKGWFIYTGYSWFRELPAGVPGAYRIFANMISLGHSPK